MRSSLEKALKGTWENKEIFYQATKHLTVREIIERIEDKKIKRKLKKVG